MRTSNSLAPNYHPAPYTVSQRHLTSSILAPYSTEINQTFDYHLTEDELEIVRVGLFVDILKFEFSEHKGYSSTDWRVLFKYWKKHIHKTAFYSASKELQKINIRKMIKEGVLTVETQKRLYGNEAWYPNILENERVQTLEWLQQLDPEDVQYTLYCYFECGLEKTRDVINSKIRKPTEVVIQPVKRDPVEITEPEILVIIEELFKKTRGFASKDSEALASFAVSIKGNPAIDLKIKEIVQKKKKNPLVSSFQPDRVAELKNRLAFYEYEDFYSAFVKRRKVAQSKSLGPQGHALEPSQTLAPTNFFTPSLGLAPTNALAPSNTQQNYALAAETSLGKSSVQYSSFVVSEEYKASYQTNQEASLKASHPLAKAKPSSPPRKIHYVKLQTSCYRAVSTASNYSQFPIHFESTQTVLPQMQSLVFYLSRFIEDRESVYRFPLEEFIQFCLELRFPIFDENTFPARSLKLGEKYKIGEAIEKTDRSKPILSESEVRMLVNSFTSSKLSFMKLHIVFQEFHGYGCKSGKALYYFWDRIKPKEKDALGIWVFEADRNEETMSEKRYERICEDRIKVLDSYYQTLEKSKQEEKEKSEKEKKASVDKLKSKYANPKRKNLYECKQTRWALGRKLLEIEKKFPIDPVVKNMIKVEFTENPLKKFDLEYEAHNEDEELKRKLGKVSIESMKVPSGQKLSQDEILKLQANRLRIIESGAQKTAEQIKEERTKEQEPQMFKSLKTLVKKYLEYKRNNEGTVATYLSVCYQSLKSQFPLAVSKNFPFKNYGSVRKQNGQLTFNKSYPIEFKHYFFALFRALLKTPKGLMILRSMPALIWAPSSKSRCTIHIDVCPPDCMFVTLNKKVLRQKMKSEQYTVAWHSKLRPFFRPDMSKEKERIFMNFSDARECRFEPVVGSKVPPKQLALTFKQFSEVRNRINPDEAPNLNMWVNKLGQNLRSAEPGLFKSGIYKQAKALFIQTKYKESKDLLLENFNIPCILNYFIPGKNRPDINEKPLEDFNKPENLQLNTQVFELYCAIKDKFRQAHSQLKSVQSLTMRDPKKTIVKFMCPDPECSKESCEFAHKVSELRFQQENKIRENFKLKLQEKIKNFQPNKQVPWVPAGSLVDCLNCHNNFLYKPKEKTQPRSGKKKKANTLRDPEIVIWSRSKCCNKCSLEQRLKEKQKNFVAKSKEMNELLLEKSGRNKYDVTGDKETKQKELMISEKIGQYRKARTLFKQRKFVEAYDVIKKVIEMVRKERDVDSRTVEKKLFEIRTTIGLDFREPAYGEENEEPADDKKMKLFETQSKRLNQGSSNDFLNYQIETFFLEVEKKLLDENNYVNNLRVKAGDLEELNEGQDEEKKNTTSFLFKPKKVKVCKFILEGLKCKKGAACEFAHFANQLDLVPTGKVIRNLGHTAEVLDTKLKNDVLPPDWKPWRGSKDLPIYAQLPLPKDLTKEKDLEKKFPFDT